MREKTIRSIISRLETQGLLKAHLQTRECSISLVRGKLTVDCWLSTADDNEESGEDRDSRVPAETGASSEPPIKGSSSQRAPAGTVLIDGEARISSFSPGKDRGEPLEGTLDDGSGGLASGAAVDGSRMTASAIRRDMDKFAAENPHLAKRCELNEMARPPEQSTPRGKVQELFKRIRQGSEREELPPLLRGDPCETHKGLTKTWMCTECGARFCGQCVRPRLGHFNPRIGMYNDKQAACPSCGRMCIDLEFEWRKGQLLAEEPANKRENIRWSVLLGLSGLFAVWTWQATYLALLIALFSFGPLRHQPRFARYFTIAVMSWITLLSLPMGTIWPPATIFQVMTKGVIVVFLILPAGIYFILLLIERLVHAIASWITS